MQENLHRVYILLILTTIIWGIQPICIKMLVTVWTPVTITAGRYIFIGTALIFLAWSRGEGILPPRKTLIPLMLMGLTGIGFNNVLQFTGLTLSTVTNCTLIAASSPAITAVMASAFVREHLPLGAWAGIALSFLGALAVISHGDINTILTFSFNRGDILFLAAQVAWTTYSLIGIGVMRKLSAIKATGWAGLFGAVIVIAFGEAAGELCFAPLSLELTLMFAYTVIFGGVLAMLWWNIGVREAGASKTAIFQNVTPLTGMLGGALILAEPVGALQIGGALSIFIGVYLTTHRR